MVNSRRAAGVLSALLSLLLLLLNFSIVSQTMPKSIPTEPVAPASTGRQSSLRLLSGDLFDAQDPETTASRCTFRQVVRSGGPGPALLALSGILFSGSFASAGTLSPLWSGSFIPHNAEQIAVFLHDLAACL